MRLPEPDKALGPSPAAPSAPTAERARQTLDEPGRPQATTNDPTTAAHGGRARLRQGRDWIRGHPILGVFWRGLVAVVGVTVTIIGVLAVPAPGPGWLIVFLGLAILASEFAFAQRWLHTLRSHVHRATIAFQALPWWARALAAGAVIAAVLGLAWFYLAWAGLPGWTPPWAANLLQALPGMAP